MSDSCDKCERVDDLRIDDAPCNKLRAEAERLQKELDHYMTEVRGVLDDLPDSVCVRPGGGPEDMLQSLAVSVRALQKATRCEVCGKLETEARRLETENKRLMAQKNNAGVEWPHSPPSQYELCDRNEEERTVSFGSISLPQPAHASKVGDEMEIRCHDLTLGQKDALANFFRLDAQGTRKTWLYVDERGHERQVRFATELLIFVMHSDGRWDVAMQLVCQEDHYERMLIRATAAFSGADKLAEEFRELRELAEDIEQGEAARVFDEMAHGLILALARKGDAKSNAVGVPCSQCGAPTGFSGYMPYEG